MNQNLIQEVLDEMAPLQRPDATTTSATVFAIRDIIREALMKFESKRMGEYHV